MMIRGIQAKASTFIENIQPIRQQSAQQRRRSAGGSRLGKGKRASNRPVLKEIPPNSKQHIQQEPVQAYGTEEKLNDQHNRDLYSGRNLEGMSYATVPVDQCQASDEALGYSDNDIAFSRLNGVSGDMRVMGTLEMEPAEMLRDASIAKLAKQDNYEIIEERGGNGCNSDPPIDLVVLDSQSAGDRVQTDQHDEGYPIHLDQIIHEPIDKELTMKNQQNIFNTEMCDRLVRRHSAANSRNDGTRSNFNRNDKHSSHLDASSANTGNLGTEVVNENQRMLDHNELRNVE